MEGEHHLPVVALEDHAVAAIARVERRVHVPGTRDLAALGLALQHAVAAACEEVAPDHAQSRALRLHQEGTVRDVAGAGNAGRAEEFNRLGREAGEVLAHRGRHHAAVARLAPLVAEHHPRHAVFDPERAVEAHPLGGSHRSHLHGLEGTLGTLAAEHPHTARLQVPALESLLKHRLNRLQIGGCVFGIGVHGIKGQRREEPIGAVVFVDFRSPDGGVLDVGRQLEDHLLVRPVVEILRGAHGDALAAGPWLRFVEVVGVAIWKDEGVADLEFVTGPGLCRFRMYAQGHKNRQ